MKITAITTIAQHSRGAKLHLQNLRWALGDDANIIVQHFKNHRMPNIPADYRPVNSDPYKFYFFWDHVADAIDDADLFVFTEQDIFITRKPVFSGNIKLSFVDDYLALFNSDGKKVYPRIWEGYTFVPGWLVRKALDEGVSLGNHVAKSESWNLTGLFTQYKERVLVKDYINFKGREWHEGDFDTLFEFSLFCFLNNAGWESTCVQDYHIAKDAVHFRGIDRLCHDRRDIYENLGGIYNPCPDRPDTFAVYQNMVNDCAAMLLLSKAHGKSLQMRSLLTFPAQKERLLLKLRQIDTHAREWMDDQEFEYLMWALSTLDRNRILLC